MTNVNDGGVPGFESRRVRANDVEVDTLIGGSGSPLLLLHGWPETRVAWSEVAPALADAHTVVIPDLRGYGRSGKPRGGGDHAAYSKRVMAMDQVETMRELGFERFQVAGHDRGARVAYRLAFDHPEVVTRLAVLDIVPTADMWSWFDASTAVSTWHWSFLAQPDGLPEALIDQAPERFVRFILEHQSGKGFEWPAAHVADYLACAGPAAVHGWCEDYRAGWGIDREHDESDRGRRLPMPVLVLWGRSGSLRGRDGVDLWRIWAADVVGSVVEGGHFVPEEAAAEVVAHFRRFFA